jgi:hypothetical protein
MLGFNLIRIEIFSFRKNFKVIPLTSLGDGPFLKID